MKLSEWVEKYLEAKRQIRELQEWANASDYTQEDLEQALEDHDS